MIKQREQHAFWWIPEFVSGELFKVKKRLKQVKFSKFLKMTAKPKVMEKVREF